MAKKGRKNVYGLLRCGARVLLVLCFSGFMMAGTSLDAQQRVNESGVPLYSEPFSRAEVLVELDPSMPVTVMKQLDEVWIQVRVTLEGGFNLTGWTKSRFFEGLPKQNDAPMDSGIDGDDSNAVDFGGFDGDLSDEGGKKKKKKKKKSPNDNGMVDLGDGSNGDLKKLWISVGPMFAVRRFEISDAMLNFPYDVSGLGVSLDAKAVPFRLMKDKLNVFLRPRFEYVIAPTETNLKSSPSSAPFQKQDTRNSFYQGSFSLGIGFDFVSSSNKQIGIKLGGAYALSTFTGDDITDLNGQTLNLYLDQALSGVAADGFFDLVFGSLQLELGAMFLVKDRFVETPLVSGLAKKNATWLAPYVNVGYLFLKKHMAVLGFRYDQKDIVFAGGGSRLGQTFTDLSQSETQYNVSLRYGLTF